MSILLLAFLILIPSSLAAIDSSSSSSSSSWKRDAQGRVRVMVQFQPNGRDALREAVGRANAAVHHTFDDLRVMAISVPEAALAGLSRNPNVVSIEEDVPRQLLAAPLRRSAALRNSKSARAQIVPYGITAVQATTAQSKGFKGANRTVCVIDSGLYRAHEDFQGLNVSGYAGNLQWDEDGDGHGTHVAGTIAAQDNSLGVIGVAPAARLYIVRVFGNDGLWAYSSSLIDATNRCRNEGGAHIISMSLGGTRPSSAEQTQFNTLNTAGILSIAAAGNDGTTGYNYPASYSTVVSVGALDSSNTLASFSNRNNEVDLAAPGVAVLSTVPYAVSVSVAIDGVATPFSGTHVENAAYGTASGTLVSGGLCTAGDASWSGKVVLCQRGTNAFVDKVGFVRNSGGVAAVIYNNVAGALQATLGTGQSSTILAVAITQADGETLLASHIGKATTVTDTNTRPASGYDEYDGTSMATPHVAGVAALVWGSQVTATNAQVRTALQNSARDLGVAGRDDSFGFGLVQADAAITALNAPPTTTSMTATLSSSRASGRRRWTATVTTTVRTSPGGTAVSGAVVTGRWTPGGTTSTCTTATNGACAVSVSVDNAVLSASFTLSSVTKSGFQLINPPSPITITKP